MVPSRFVWRHHLKKSMGKWWIIISKKKRRWDCFFLHWSFHLTWWFSVLTCFPWCFSPTWTIVDNICFGVYSVRNQLWSSASSPPIKRGNWKSPIFHCHVWWSHIIIYIPLCLAISHAIPIKSLKNPSFHYWRVPYFPKAMESQCRYLNYPLVN